VKVAEYIIKNFFRSTFISVTLPPLWVQSIVISMSVCLSVCLHISRTTHPYFTKFAAHINSGSGLVL